jgi:hypothetical protein
VSQPPDYVSQPPDFESQPPDYVSQPPDYVSQPSDYDQLGEVLPANQLNENELDTKQFYEKDQDLYLLEKAPSNCTYNFLS